MKSHFLSKFDSFILWETLKLFVIGIACITIALIVGLTDNIPMILLELSGIVLLFYAVLYPWEKVKYYAIMAVMFAILFLLLLFFWNKHPG